VLAASLKLLTFLPSLLKPQPKPSSISSMLLLSNPMNTRETDPYFKNQALSFVY